MYTMHTNKKTTTRPLMKYAALSSGTADAVWYDEDQSAKSAQKRQNRIVLKRETAEKNKEFDA